jgi:hypothetical protein
MKISSTDLVKMLGHEGAVKAILKEVEKGNPPIREIRNFKVFLKMKYLKDE